jgi:hypothetical protein
VFNLRGCKFSNIIKSNLKDNGEDKYIINGIKQNIPSKTFLDKSVYFQNTYGVFRNPLFNELDTPIIDYDHLDENKNSDPKVIPLHYTITLEDEDVRKELKECGVKYCFFVRQKRIPMLLFQGLSLNVDKYSGSPMLYDGTNYYTESFLTNATTYVNKNYGDIVQEESSLIASKTCSITGATNGSVLISPDASFVIDLQNQLCGTNLQFEKLSEITIPTVRNRNHMFTKMKKLKTANVYNFQGVFMNEGIPHKIIKDFHFSTRFGSPELVKEKSFFGKELDAMNPDQEHSAYNAKNWSILRGIYTSCVCVCGNLPTQCLYNVYTGDYSSVYTDMYIQERGLDHSPFYSISEKFTINDLSNPKSI